MADEYLIPIPDGAHELNGAPVKMPVMGNGVVSDRPSNPDVGGYMTGKFVIQLRADGFMRVFIDVPTPHGVEQLKISQARFATLSRVGDSWALGWG